MKENHTWQNDQTQITGRRELVARLFLLQNPIYAGAPELLAACQRALDMMADLKIPSVKTRLGFSANVTRAALAAAIAKAEGR